MIELISKNDPITAIVTYNNFMVGSALASLEKKHYRTGEDVASWFYNGLISRYVHPKLIIQLK
jgi:LacI family transcriptional regulator